MISSCSLNLCTGTTDYDRSFSNHSLRHILKFLTDRRMDASKQLPRTKSTCTYELSKGVRRNELLWNLNPFKGLFFKNEELCFLCVFLSWCQLSRNQRCWENSMDTSIMFNDKSIKLFLLDCIVFTILTIFNYSSLLPLFFNNNICLRPTSCISKI